MQVVIPFFTPEASYRFIADERGAILAVVYLRGDAFLRISEAD